MSAQFSSIRSIDWSLSGVSSLGLRGPGNGGNKGVLRISQSVSIGGASPSDCLVSYPGPSLGESCPSTEMQSVYLTAPAE